MRGSPAKRHIERVTSLLGHRLDSGGFLVVGFWLDLVRFGGVRSDLAGSGRIWWGVVGCSGIWWNLVGFGGICGNLVGFGGILDGFGGVWSDLATFGRIWSGLVGPGRVIWLEFPGFIWIGRMIGFARAAGRALEVQDSPGANNR